MAKDNRYTKEEGSNVLFLNWPRFAQRTPSMVREMQAAERYIRDEVARQNVEAMMKPEDWDLSNQYALAFKESRIMFLPFTNINKWLTVETTIS